MSVIALQGMMKETERGTEMGTATETDATGTVIGTATANITVAGVNEANEASVKGTETEETVNVMDE